MSITVVLEQMVIIMILITVGIILFRKKCCPKILQDSFPA